MKPFILTVFYLLSIAVNLKSQLLTYTGLFWNENLIDDLKGSINYVQEVTFDVKYVFGEVVKDKKSFEVVAKFGVNGNVTEKSIYLTGYDEVKHTYTYNNNGNLIEQNQYEKDGSLLWRYIYRYNSKGIRIGEETFKPDGSISTITQLTYYTDGKLKEELNIEPNGKFSSRIFFTYWPNKTLKTRTFEYPSEYKTYDGGELISTELSKRSSVTHYRYNSQRKLIEEEEEGYVKYYKYDANGNNIEQSFELFGEYNHKAILVYDKVGNWIKLIVYEGLVPTKIVERQITYN